nr:MAG TPA: hypothetical protein [Caudoviricetes sp.]
MRSDKQYGGRLKTASNPVSVKNPESVKQA